MSVDCGLGMKPFKLVIDILNILGSSLLLPSTLPTGRCRVPANGDAAGEYGNGNCDGRER